MQIPLTITRALRFLIPDPPARVFCIGDSHCSFFSGQTTMQKIWPRKSKDLWPFFRTFRIGPALAYNLCKTGTKSQGREKLLEVLTTKVPVGERVLLCFGEIDCRAHLIRQSESQGQPVADLAATCVDRYFQVIKEVRSMNYRVMIWNVVPPTVLSCQDCEFPVAGSFQERMAVTRTFNDRLSSLCQQHDIPFISIFDAILDATGRPNPHYFADGIHLGQTAMSLAIEAIREHCPEVDFNLYAKKKSA